MSASEYLKSMISGPFFIGMGDIHYHLGQFEPAAILYQEALDQSRSLNLGSQVALIENNLGVGQGQRGRLEDARKHFATARGLWPALPGTEIEAAATLANEGAMFVEYGEYHEALDRFQAVLKLLDNRPGQDNIPIVLINMRCRLSAARGMRWPRPTRSTFLGRLPPTGGMPRRRAPPTSRRCNSTRPPARAGAWPPPCIISGWHLGRSGGSRRLATR